MMNGPLLTGVHDFQLPNRVLWGKPAGEAVADECARLGADRVFFVSSRSVATKTPVLEMLAARLGTRFVGTFSDCQAHVPRPSLLQAAEAIRHASPDLIVAVGGGMVADTVKVAQICLAHDVKRIEDLDDLHTRVTPDGTRIVPAINPSPVRQIAVPTTLSAAEFGSLAGSTDPRTGAKHSFSSPDFSAVTVILDPAVTIYTPEWLWLSSGVRALDHAIEAICSIDSNPYVEGLAAHAVGMLAKALSDVHADGASLVSRLRCQQATWLASAAINRVNFGASHGLGHVLGGLAHVPHGYTSCVLLPSVLAWNLEKTRGQQERIAALLDRPGGADASGAVRALVEQLGLPARIRDLGMDESLLPHAAELAMANMWVRTNPRPIVSPADVLEILKAAW